MTYQYLKYKGLKKFDVYLSEYAKDNHIDTKDKSRHQVVAEVCLKTPIDEVFLWTTASIMFKEFGVTEIERFYWTWKDGHIVSMKCVSNNLEFLPIHIPFSIGTANIRFSLKFSPIHIPSFINTLLDPLYLKSTSQIKIENMITKIDRSNITKFFYIKNLIISDIFPFIFPLVFDI